MSQNQINAAANYANGARNLSNQHPKLAAEFGAGAAIGTVPENKQLSSALAGLFDEIGTLEGCIDALAEKLTGLLPPPEPATFAEKAVSNGEPMSPTTQRALEAMDYVRRQRDRIERLRRHVQV